MLLQRKINTEYANIQKTQVDLQAVRLLANLTPTLVAAEQRYNATQVKFVLLNNHLTISSLKGSKSCF